MRLVVTKKTDLAVKSLVLLSRAKARLKAAEIAEALNNSAGFTTQAMTPLVSKGWVTSTKGPTGGYELAVEISSLSMLNVIEAVEGLMSEYECALEGGPCEKNKTCSMHDAVVASLGVLITHLAHTKLPDHWGDPIPDRQ